MKEATSGILAAQDVAALDSHFKTIAELYQSKRIWRNNWRVELNGCIYKFHMTGYAKNGSEIWNEQQAETNSLACFCPYFGEAGGYPKTVSSREYQGDSPHGGMVEHTEERCSLCAKGEAE